MKRFDLLVTFLILMVSSLSFGQIPSNDECTGAIDASPLPYTNTQDATLATNNDGFIIVASCGGMNDGIWYTVMGDGGNITVNVAPEAWDNAIGVYTGSCGALVCEGIIDANVVGLAEEITFASLPGTVYYINTGEWSSTSDDPEGAYDISITSDASPSDNCGHEQVSNNLESATFILEGAQKIANDFIVDLNTTNFTLNSITANLISQGGFTSIDIIFYEDAGGFPGTQIGATIEDLVSTSQTIIGANFDFDFHEVVLDLPVPIDFAGTGTEAVTYWVELVTNVPASIGGIETTTLNPIGEFISVNFNNGGGWLINTVEDCVFEMDGECTLITGCLAVTNITFPNIMADQATISWNDAGMSTGGYILSVFDAGADPDTETPVYTENVARGITFTTATGLIGNSIYDVYITADCGGGELSVRNMSSFLTAPLIPICGDKFYDTGGAGGDYSPGEDYAITILPDNVGDVVTATFVFVATSIIVDGFPTVDVLTVDVGDGVTQLVPETPVGGSPASYTSVAADGSLFFTFASQVGPGFVPSAGWDADITCGLPPACLPATNFMVTGVTDITADFSWDAEPNASNGYIITVFNAGDNPFDGGEVTTVNVPFGTNTATIPGLPQDNAYEAYIASDCDTDGASANSSPVPFITEQSILTCEDQFIDSGGVDENYQNDELRTTFFVPDTPGEVVTITFTYVDIEASGTGGTEGCWDYLTIYDGPDTSSPVLAAVKCGEESGDTGQPAPPSSVLLIGDSFTASNPDGMLTVVFTSNDGGTETGWEADVTCGPPPTCIPPNNFINTGITDATASFSWDEEPNASSGYVVTVFLEGDDPDVDTPIGTEMVPFGTNTGTIMGLSSETVYDAYIISDCGVDDGVSTTRTVSFTTGLSPLTCGDQFIDSGGVDGSYQNSELRTVTMLPSSSENPVTITFTYVDIESAGSAGNQDGCWDYLTIYDGPDTSSPVLAATLCGEESGNGNVPSVPASLLSVGDSFTATNTDGALTVVFTSDGSVSPTGWAADVACVVVSVDEIIGADFNYYPNPTTGILAITAKHPIGVITIFDIIGQKVLEIHSNALDTELDLSSLHAGTYIMRSTINGTSYTHKVIKN